jgi:hypothetical protein
MEVSLSDIQRSLLTFLQKRSDVVIFGAYAINAYLNPNEMRMTADVNIQTLRGQLLVTQISEHLHQEFYIAPRSREVKPGQAWRIYHDLRSGNRHLVDIRQVEHLPNFEVINQIQVLSPLELIQAKIISAYARQHQPKGFSDLRDLYSLMLTFPELADQVNLPVEDAKIQDFWKNIKLRQMDFPEPDHDLNY